MWKTCDVSKNYTWISCDFSVRESTDWTWVQFNYILDFISKFLTEVFVVFIAFIPFK